MLVFEERGKPGEPGEKPLGARMRTNNKLNPHMTPSPGIKPRPHWWEVNAQPLRHSHNPYSVTIVHNSHTRFLHQNEVKFA